MARQRVRAESTWAAARAARKALVEKLAKWTVDNVSGQINLNSVGHCQDVGRYKALTEILWECDK